MLGSPGRGISISNRVPTVAGSVVIRYRPPRLTSRAMNRRARTQWDARARMESSTLAGVPGPSRTPMGCASSRAMIAS